MGEVLNKIITYAKEHTRFLAPALQSELHLGYRELTGALKTLQEKGAIKFIGGMCYEYFTEPKKDDSSLKDRSEDEDDSAEKRRAYLEMRRQEIIRRMQEEMDNDDEDDESDYEDKCDEVMTSDKKTDSSMPDPTTLKVLHYCIQRQCASTSLIQRRFPIGYIRAVKIIDWMESMGYVASSNSSTSKKMLLTEEKFIELYIQDNEDEKVVKRTAEFREVVGNLCGVLKRIAEEKDNETRISDDFLDEIKSRAEGNLFEIYRSVCFVNICAKGLTFSNGEKAEFFIHHYGKITELCDGGVTGKWMRRKPGYGYKRTKNTLEKLTEGSMIRMDDREQLLVEVSDLSKLPATYYYFYWLIENLIA